MDGARDDSSVCQAESSDESTKAGKHSVQPRITSTRSFAAQLHDVASGLDYLHDQPFVHSDIKSVGVEPFTSHQPLADSLYREIF